MKTLVQQHLKRHTKLFSIMDLLYSKAKNTTKHLSVSKKYHWEISIIIQSYGIIWAFALSNSIKTYMGSLNMHKATSFIPSTATLSLIMWSNIEARTVTSKRRDFFWRQMEIQFQKWNWKWKNLNKIRSKSRRSFMLRSRNKWIMIKYKVYQRQNRRNLRIMPCRTTLKPIPRWAWVCLWTMLSCTCKMFSRS